MQHLPQPQVFYFVGFDDVEREFGSHLPDSLHVYIAHKTCLGSPNEVPACAAFTYLSCRSCQSWGQMSWVCRLCATRMALLGPAIMPLQGMPQVLLGRCVAASLVIKPSY